MLQLSQKRIPSNSGRDFYLIQDQIGSGASGQVSRCYRNGNLCEVFAIKQIEDNKKTREEADLTLKVIQKCQGKGFQNFVLFEEVIYFESKIYFIMEFCNGQQLYRLCQNKQLDLLEKIDIIIQVAKGIQEMHSIELIHRDLKPENIVHHCCPLTGENIYKICDIGISKLSNVAATTYIGTPYYMSPEMLNNQSQYTNSVDIWSFGCMIIELLTGKLFFNGSNHRQIYEQINKFSNRSKSERKNILNQTINSQYSEYFLDVVFYMLSVEPSSRPKAAQVIDYFQRLRNYLLANPLPQPQIAQIAAPVQQNLAKVNKQKPNIKLVEQSSSQQLSKQSIGQNILANYDSVYQIQPQNNQQEKVQSTKEQTDTIGQEQKLQILNQKIQIAQEPDEPIPQVVDFSFLSDHIVGVNESHKTLQGLDDFFKEIKEIVIRVE